MRDMHEHIAIFEAKIIPVARIERADDDYSLLAYLARSPEKIESFVRVSLIYLCVVNDESNKTPKRFTQTREIELQAYKSQYLLNKVP